MTADTVRTPDLARAEQLIAVVPDFPEPGILFRDIAPLLADAAALRTCVDALVAPFAGTFDVVAGIEARGFLLAGAAAIVTGTGMVPIRKAGKLPRPAASVSYSLEYGEAAIECSDDFPAGTRVLVLDDVLATGGTMKAASELLGTLGAVVVGQAVLLELDALGGRSVAGDVHTLFHA